MSQSIKVEEEKPDACPLCDGHRITIRRNGAGWYIGCNDCDLGMSVISDPVKFWNNRVREKRLQKLIENLKEKT